jgi:TPP-dependent pyruvate/acetoin dehydrogenase alpha subunit
MTETFRLRVMRHMLRIRAVEDEIARRYPRGEMRCPVHLSIGQEAVPAAFAECVRHEDFAMSTHRGHAHYLAKGGSLQRMLDEIYGKASGCARGRGGSMHLIDLAVNFMGTSAIVGNSIPIGVGLALSAQLRRSDQVSCIFFGDGATEEGVFYESINFAAVRQLPALFICENNLYSVYSPLSVRQPVGRNIAKMVEALGITTWSGDGNCAEDSYENLAAAFAHVRAGCGPAFVELATYRWREHCGPNYDNDIGYRGEDEFRAWQTRDPVANLRVKLGAEGKEQIVADIEAEITNEITRAFAHAEAAPFPDPTEAYASPYAE